MVKGRVTSNSSTSMPDGAKELKHQVERLQALMEEIPTGVINVDIKGKITYVNKTILQATGYLREELVGKNGLRLGLIPPETLKLLGKRMKEKLMGKPPSPLEIQFKRKDGRWMWIEITGRVLWEHGVPVGVQIVGQDITERKQAEEKLKSSEERLKILFEFAPDAYYLNDLKGNFIDGNRAAEEITGYKRDELIGKSFLKLKLLPPRQIPKAAALLAKNALGQATGPDEFTLIRKDGNQVPVETRTFPVKIKGKTSVLGIARNITERKRAEHALNERVKELNCLYGIARIDESPGIISDELYQEIANLLPASWQYPQITCARIIINNKEFKTRNCRDTEWKQSSDIKIHGAKVGAVEVAYLEARPELDEGPFLKEERLLIDAVAKQLARITERMQAEQALQKSEARYREIADSITDVFFAFDTGLRYTYWNKASEELTGISAKDALGKHLYDLFPDVEMTRRAEEEYLKVLRTKQPQHFVTEYQLGGKDFFFEISAYPTKNGLSVFTKDITERKRMEKELREAQEQLVRSEKLAAIGQLAGGVGHELRNPLAAIKNAVYYVKGKVAESELAQEKPRLMEFLNIMDEEINSSNKIISDLLGFSRVGKPSVSPTGIEKIIEDTLPRITIPENIELTKKLDGELPEVEIDPDQIQQVLVNIITNAVQAMPEGGKLTIVAREKDKFVEVEVADTGCGIPQESVNKIFDPLFTTRAKGIGLGLAVCKSIIDRHEGNITVKSKVGKGTTISIKLPLESE